MSERISEMELMALDTEGEVRHIKLAGRLDTQGADAIGTKFGALCGVRTKYAMVDISGVEFLSSMGIRLLVTAARSCARNGGKFAVYGPGQLVLEAIRMASLDEMMTVAATKEEALAVIAG